MTPRKVVIIGAGPGGLASGMLLASRGYNVHIFDRQPYIGGRTSRIRLGDFKFDRGPTFLMLPSLLEELFAAADRDLHHYVKLLELHPLYRLQFGSQRFEPSRNQEATFEQIRQLFPGNEDGYLRFMKDEREKFHRISPLLQRPFSKLRDYASRDVFAALPRLHALDTVYGRLSKYFTDEKLKYAFSFQAKYLGMSPWECPGTFTMLSYLEHAYGLHHPIGGVNQICKAMGEVIGEYGGSIHINRGVSKIITRNGEAAGIRLEDGSELSADHVIINADFASAMGQLFEPGELRKHTPEKLASKKYSCSTYMLYLGLNREVALPHHTIFFADDYKKNVDDMTKRFQLSKDPSIYVHNPGALDRTLAPHGKTALYLLMPVPNLSSSFDWENREEEIRAQMLDRLEREPELRHFTQDIEIESSITPLGWRDQHGVYRGATFNLAHSLDQMMMLRPHNRFEEFRNCWLVGGGTHPGSGLPTIFESARISARLLMEQDRKSGVFSPEPLQAPASFESERRRFL